MPIFLEHSDLRVRNATRDRPQPQQAQASVNDGEPESALICKPVLLMVFVIFNVTPFTSVTISKRA
jgi:hypothetical protein